MMLRLSWSALFCIVLGGLVWWSEEEDVPPMCREVLPTFGANACCESHRAADDVKFPSVAKFEAARRAGVR